MTALPLGYRFSRWQIALVAAALLLLLTIAAGLALGPALLAPPQPWVSYRPPAPAEVAQLADRLMLQLGSLQPGQSASITLDQQQFELLHGVLLHLMGEAGQAVPQPGVPGSPLPLAVYHLRGDRLEVHGVAVTPLLGGIMRPFSGRPVGVSVSLAPHLEGNSLRISVDDLRVGRFNLKPARALRRLASRLTAPGVAVDPAAATITLRLPPSVTDPLTGYTFTLDALAISDGQVRGTVRRVR